MPSFAIHNFGDTGTWTENLRLMKTLHEQVRHIQLLASRAGTYVGSTGQRTRAVFSPNIRLVLPISRYIIENSSCHRYTGVSELRITSLAVAMERISLEREDS